MRECYLVRKIRKHLKLHYDIESFKHHGGPYSERGVADIIGCWGGRFLAIEVKAGGMGKATRRLSKWQEDWLVRYAMAGGVCGMVCCMEDVDDLLKKYADFNPFIHTSHDIDKKVLT